MSAPALGLVHMLARTIPPYRIGSPSAETAKGDPFGVDVESCKTFELSESMLVQHGYVSKNKVYDHMDTMAMNNDMKLCRYIAKKKHKCRIP